MRGVPIAMIIKAAGVFENAGELVASGPHKVDVCLRAGVPILESPLFPCLTPKYFVIPIAVKWWVDVNQVDALVG